MINFFRPTPEQIQEAQLQEQSYYWSNCAELFFAKHGFLTSNTSCDLQVVLRGTPSPTLCAQSPTIIEGPLCEDQLKELGLRAKTWKAAEVHVFDEHKKQHGKVVYSTFMTKRIPKSSKEKTFPQHYADPNPLWRAKPVRTQVFEYDAERWTPVLFARINDQWAPIAVTDGSTLVLGIPLFDIIGFNHTMPAIDDGFYRAARVWPLLMLERWLRDQIIALTSSSDTPIVLPAEWPAGERGCLSVRHDYDRDISEGRLDSILAFYDKHGIKATWFLIEGKAPPAGQAEKMVRAGHEIALHTIAPTFEAMQDETNRFIKRYGQRPTGFTCHGGIGSRGHLALNHNRWAIELGMEYGEFIGRCRGFPHALIDPETDPNNPCPTIQHLMLQDCHHSLDLTMKPDAHQLVFLGQDIPRCLDRNEHVIIMNHPDIHWDQLQELISNLDLSSTWLATLEQAAKWTHDQKYSTLTGQGGQCAIPALCQNS